MKFQVVAPVSVGAESTGMAGEVGGVPKWVLGLAIGVPVAAALAYIIFGGSSDEGGKKTKKAENKKTTPVKPSPKKEPAPTVEKKVEQVQRYNLCLIYQM